VASELPDIETVNPKKKVSTKVTNNNYSCGFFDVDLFSYDIKKKGHIHHDTFSNRFKNAHLLKHIVKAKFKKMLYMTLV